MGGDDAQGSTTGWSARRVPRSALPGLVLFVVFTVCGLVALAGGVVDGDGTLIVGGAVLLLLFGSLTGFLLTAVSLGSGAEATLVPWPGGGTQAVRFRYRTAAYVWFGAVLAMLTVFLLGLAAAWLAWGGTGERVAALVLVGGAALLGWYLVVMLRFAPGGLFLSPAGVAHRGPTTFYSVPWSAVYEVEARMLGVSAIVVKAYPSPESVLRRHTGLFHIGELSFLPFMVVRTWFLAADREVVRQALACYHAHPELRSELATPAGPARIAAGRLTA